jgi:zinc protease
VKAAILFLFPVLAAAQTPQKVASVEGITEYRFHNGLRLLLFPDPSKPTITVNVTYLVGSRHENYGETGMAHIVEHLVSYGSPRHPDAKAEQQARGARRNATTWYDRTNYYEIFPASGDNLEWALDLEADRMLNAFIKKEILQSQMSVVRNEYEAGENNPLRVLTERVLSTAFLWHNYGKSTIGARSDIENVPIERLEAFYKTYYQPDNAVVVVAGKFDEAKAVEIAAAKFGPLPRPARRLPPTYTSEPVQDGERTVTLRRVGDIQGLIAGYHVPAGPHPDHAAVALLAGVLGSSPGGRLHKALVETKKAVAVSAYSYALNEPGMLLLRAVVRKEASLDDARDALLRTVDSVAAEPVTAQEVDRARAQILKEIELNLTDPENIGLQLSEWSAQGDWRLLFLHRDRVREATPADVQRVAVAYLKPSNRTLGLFIPEAAPVRAEIPAAPDVAALVKDYRGDPAFRAGEAFDPSPANIEKRAVRTRLPSGLQLVLIPKRTRGGTVHGVLRLYLGDEAALRNRAVESELARDMLARGAAGRTRQQIRDELDRLKARTNVTGAAHYVEIGFQTVRDNFEAVGALLADMLRRPTFPAGEFEQLRQEALARYESQRSEPQFLAMNALNRHLNPYPAGDPRYVPTPDEQVAALRAVTLDGVRQFHRDFYGPALGQLVIVGDVEPSDLEARVAEWTAGWKNARSPTDLKSPFQKVPAREQSIETPDKANAMFVAGLPMPLSEADADYPALLLANYMLGGHSTSRLYTRIRAKEGLSYGVFSNLAAHPTESSARWMTFAIANPQNVRKVEAAFRDEIARALKDGFSDDEVATAKKGWSQAQQVSRSQDDELARRLRAQTHVNRTMAFDADLEKKVYALTPGQITAALRKHLDPAQLSIVKAGDFRKAAPATP